MTRNTIDAMLKIMNVDRPFYASEFEINGGTMGGLMYWGLVKETGNTKTYYIDTYGNHAIKCEVKEWVVNKNGFKKVKRYIEGELKQMENLIALSVMLENF